MPIAAQTVSGPIDKVPCPWCGKTNNFSSFDDLLADVSTPVGDGDPGDSLTFECDHCTKKMRVIAMRNVPTVFVRQVK